jgi:hypothetical protein
MLPKNALRVERMKQLKIYAAETHPHVAQFPLQLTAASPLEAYVRIYCVCRPNISSFYLLLAFFVFLRALFCRTSRFTLRYLVFLFFAQSTQEAIRLFYQGVDSLSDAGCAKGCRLIIPLRVCRAQWF